MGIDVILRQENREDIASVGDPRWVLSRAVTNGRFSKTQLLKYLVPWGDAVFNSVQAQDLVDDIRLVSAGNIEPSLKEHLLEVKTLVERLETRSYLWFIGD
jgi:hypothetical protein